MSLILIQNDRLSRPILNGAVMLPRNRVLRHGRGCEKTGLWIDETGALEPMNSSSIDLSKVVPLVDLYLNSGFSYFDVGILLSWEKKLGGLRAAVAKRWPRESYTITDKLPIYGKPEERELLPIFNDRLLRLMAWSILTFICSITLAEKTISTPKPVHAFECTGQQRRGARGYIGPCRTT